MALGSTYDPIFQAAGQEWNVDPILLKAVATQESGGDRDPNKSLSSTGAQGIMNIMPETQRGLGVIDPSDPTQNIYGGAKYLSEALNAEKTPEDALRYYHGGPNWRAKYGAESAGYAPAVTAHYQALAQATQPAAPQTAVQPAPAAPTQAEPAAQAAPAAAPAAPAAAAPPGAPDADRAAGAALIASMAPGAAKPSAAAPTDPDTAAGMALVHSLAPPAAPAAPGAPGAAPGAAGSGYDARLKATADEAHADTPINRAIAAAGPAANALASGVGSAASAVGAVASPIVSAVGNALQGEFGAGSAPYGMDAAQMAELRESGIVPPTPGGGTFLQRLNEGAVNALAPVVDAAGRVASVAGAGMGAASNALIDAGVPRDIVALPEAFAGSPNSLVKGWEGPTYNPLRAGNAAVEAQVASEARAAQATAQVAQAARADAQAAPLGADFTANPLAAGYKPPAPAGPTSPNPVVGGMVGGGQPSVGGMGGGGPPGPQSMGAAASRDMSNPADIAMSPAQVQAYRSDAELARLLERQQPNFRDATAYVPGVTINSAEMEQTVNTARELKALNMTAPDVSQEAKDTAAFNNDARDTYVKSIIPGKGGLLGQKEAQQTQLDSDYPAAFANKTAADAQPVANVITDMLATPRGLENTQLQKYVAPLLDRLTNADGTLKTDPEQLYGLREDINRMQSKASQADDPNLSHVAGQLRTINVALDQAIESGAPGYRNYMDNYAAAQRGIDQTEVLQGHEPGLYDQQNRITYGNMHRMMSDIVEGRAAPGLNQYKSITDDTMDKLWNLHSDLRRSASAQELARAQGSDTAQNAWDMVKGAMNGSAGTIGAHVAGTILSGPAGGLLAGVGKNMLANMFAQRTLRQQTARGMALLHPPQQNALMPPP